MFYAKKRRKFTRKKNFTQIFEQSSYGEIRPCYQSQWLWCCYFRRASVWNWGLRNDYIQERLVKPNYVAIHCKTNSKFLSNTHIRCIISKAVILSTRKLNHSLWHLYMKLQTLAACKASILSASFQRSLQGHCTCHIITVKRNSLILFEVFKDARFDSTVRHVRNLRNMIACQI